MAHDRGSSTPRFGTDAQAHLVVIILVAVLFLVYQATSHTAGISRVEMAQLGIVSGSTPLPPPASELDSVLTVDGSSLLPLDSVATASGSIAQYVGESAIGRGVPVLSVTADEGFWVGMSPSDRVWVQLTGDGESPYTVRPADLAYFLGTVVAHAPSYAATACVGDARGAKLLTAQEAHIEVPQDNLTLNR
ncbi:MAG: hypothetical protein M3313_00610 [Actinomycetota bacterium]|nr:hypothetical protein [Actinomycetota bacterium]